MDYYRLADGTLVGTQADARASKQKWEAHAVPTDKKGLMSYVNALVLAAGSSSAHDSDAAAVQQPPAPVVAPAASTAPLPQDRAARLIALEDAIQDANGYELGRLTSNVMSRLEELRREAGIAA